MTLFSLSRGQFVESQLKTYLIIKILDQFATHTYRNTHIHTYYIYPNFPWCICILYSLSHDLSAFYILIPSSTLYEKNTQKFRVLQLPHQRIRSTQIRVVFSSFPCSTRNFVLGAMIDMAGLVTTESSVFSPNKGLLH